MAEAFVFSAFLDTGSDALRFVYYAGHNLCFYLTAPYALCLPGSFNAIG